MEDSKRIIGTFKKQFLGCEIGDSLIIEDGKYRCKKAKTIGYNGHEFRIPEFKEEYINEYIELNISEFSKILKDNISELEDTLKNFENRIKN